MKKKCIRCGEEKELDCFYAHNQMKDGHVNVCKECSKKGVRERERRLKETDPEWAFKERERHRLKQEKRRLKIGKEQRGKEKFQYKRKATRAVSRVPCPPGFQRHHWSYNEEHWKDIFIVTTDAHLKIHRYTIYDEEQRMYRRLDGVLLDSRLDAEDYYAKIMDVKDGCYPDFLR